MNAFKKLFKIGNKDSFYLRETFETLKGRLTDLILLTNQTLISMISMSTNIIFKGICLVLKKSQGSLMNAGT